MKFNISPIRKRVAQNELPTNIALFIASVPDTLKQCMDSCPDSTNLQMKLPRSLPTSSLQLLVDNLMLAFENNPTAMPEETLCTYGLTIPSPTTNPSFLETIKSAATIQKISFDIDKRGEYTIIKTNFLTNCDNLLSRCQPPSESLPLSTQINSFLAGKTRFFEIYFSTPHQQLLMIDYFIERLNAPQIQNTLYNTLKTELTNALFTNIKDNDLIDGILIEKAADDTYVFHFSKQIEEAPTGKTPDQSLEDYFFKTLEFTCLNPETVERYRDQEEKLKRAPTIELNDIVKDLEDTLPKFLSSPTNSGIPIQFTRPVSQDEALGILDQLMQLKQDPDNPDNQVVYTFTLHTGNQASKETRFSSMRLKLIEDNKLEFVQLTPVDQTSSESALQKAITATNDFLYVQDTLPTENGQRNMLHNMTRHLRHLVSTTSMQHSKLLESLIRLQPSPSSGSWPNFQTLCESILNIARQKVKECPHLDIDAIILPCIDEYTKTLRQISPEETRFSSINLTNKFQFLSNHISEYSDPIKELKTLSSEFKRISDNNDPMNPFFTMLNTLADSISQKPSDYKNHVETAVAFVKGQPYDSATEFAALEMIEYIAALTVSASD